MRRLFLLILVAVLIAGVAAFPAAGRDRVRIHVKWLHGAQFAGLYAAGFGGLFEAPGPDVEITPGAATEDVLVALASVWMGTKVLMAQFGLLLADFDPTEADTLDLVESVYSPIP